MKGTFANIALDIPVDSLFTYSIPGYLTDKVETGARVLVPFGKRVLTGFIVSFADECGFENVKDVKSLLDDEPALTDEMLRFGMWISEYYLSPPGEILAQFIPKKLSIKSEISYCLSEDYTAGVNALRNAKDIVLDIVSLFAKSPGIKLTKKQIDKRLNLNTSYYVEFLSGKGILVKEKLYSQATKELTVKCAVRNFKEKTAEEAIAAHGIKAVKQVELIELLAENEKIEIAELGKRHKIASSTVNSLYKKGILNIIDLKKERGHTEMFEEEDKKIVLNGEQEVCLKKIIESADSGKFKSFLLHGVTGSGKTEVYIRALEDVISKGKTGIVLVPEISLTPQLIKRFKNRFGEKVGVIHSKLSEGERLDTYNGIQNGKYRIVIGPRSALFAPLKKPGLIIVDEEHEGSYKQENSPRYNARDMAVIRAKINEAVVVLGSATPSVESYFNAKNGKYELLTLSRRATESTMPFVRIIDMKKRSESDGFEISEEIEKLRVRYFSKELAYDVKRRLERKESTILLQNRRGYHSYIECLTCGHVETCDRCSVSLTYHKKINLLKCHLCGFTKKVMAKCTECSSERLVESGAGTEKVEEFLTGLFPEARIERMDSDTMVSKYKYQKVLSDFYKGHTDILVGTQIISKGLDFPNVTLVGVINADIGMLLPDFRATERTFQLLTQVSGRSGRSDKEGEVVIQTNHPEYKLFEKVADHDYEGFYETEIRSREAGIYPPFSRIGLVEIKSKNQKLADLTAKDIYNKLKDFRYYKYLQVLPPSQPLISKAKDFYRYHLVIKSSKTTDVSGKLLTDALKHIRNSVDHKGDIRISFDVDAMNFI
ncbi:MAG: primosomal protein N' [Bacteroidetes bacterium]|nr:primosomal protein N' [Bacteroidota bacterium]